MTDSMDNEAQDFQQEALAHMDALYRYARRLTSSEGEAEDLLQETFLRAYRFWGRYEKGTNCKAWLFRIMRNLNINQAQAKGRKSQHESLDEVEDWYLYNRLAGYQTGADDNPEKIFFKNNWSVQIREALAQLPDEFRDPLLLCDVEGFSYQEIAEVLDIPIGTVRSRLNRARKKMQKLLWEYVKEELPRLLKKEA